MDGLAVNDLAKEHYATPAIADGRLYVRTKSTLYAFGLGEGAPERVGGRDWNLIDSQSLLCLDS